MDKEKILEKSRLENKNKDIVNAEALKKGSKVATIVGMLVCCGLAVLQIIFKETIDASLWVIYFSMMFTREISKFFFTKEKASLVMGLIFCAICLFFLIVYVFQLLGK